MILTVVIPVYNQADWLSEALEGLKSQTDKEFQIVISDNCSTDHISSIIEKYNEIKNLTYIKEEEFLDKTSNWNRAVNYSKTEYTLLHHSDDILMKGTISLLKESIQLYPDVVLFHGAHVPISLDSTILDNDIKAKFKYIYGDKENLLNLVCNVSIVGVTFKTEKFKEVGLFDKNYKQLQDWDLYIKLIKKGKFMYVGSILGYWRVGKLSDSLHHIQNIETIKLLTDTKDNIFKRFNLNNKIKQHLKFYKQDNQFKDEYTELLDSLNLYLRDSLLSEMIVNNYVKLIKFLLMFKFKVGLK